MNLKLTLHTDIDDDTVPPTYFGAPKHKAFELQFKENDPETQETAQHLTESLIEVAKSFGIELSHVKSMSIAPFTPEE